MDLQGKAALITGGTRMGDAVAAVLAEGGADVAFTYRMSPDAAERAAAVVRARGRRASRCTPTSAIRWSAARQSTKPRRRSAGSTSW